jgi:proline dehydrogenase
MWTGLLFRVAKHWIAGDNYEDALKRAQQSSARKVRGIINLLGEDTTSTQEVETTTAEYLEVLNQLDARKVQSCISMKPTQLGLAIDKAVYRYNLERIVEKAKSLNNFVWVDMEGHDYTAETVDSYIDFRKRYDNIGVAIQAYMKRSEEDVNRILDVNGMIRMTKGAYNESPEIVYKKRSEISHNFSKLIRIMFERGKWFAIATHDEKLIKEAITLSNVHHADFEFEMLMGIRDKRKLELIDQGYHVSEYIPYGKSWWAYSKRRMTEHKSNIFLLARSLISG